MIRQGAEESLVTGVLDVFEQRGSPGLAALPGTRARGGPGPHQARGSRRTAAARPTSRTRARCAPDLAELTSLLVDLHGQHEHQSLLKSENHRLLLDRYARIEAEVEAFGARFAALSAEKRAYDSALASEAERGREIEFLRFSVDEIAKAKLRAGEEAELEAEELLLSQHEKLFAAMETAHEALSGSTGGEGGGEGALAALRRMRSSLEGAQTIDPSLSDLARRSDDAFYELEDVADSLRHYIGTHGFRPERLEEVEERLADIRKLKKKYGSSIEEVLARLEEDRSRLTRLETWEEDKSEIERKIAAMEAELLAEAPRPFGEAQDCGRGLAGQDRSHRAQARNAERQVLREGGPQGHRGRPSRDRFGRRGRGRIPHSAQPRRKR